MKKLMMLFLVIVLLCLVSISCDNNEKPKFVKVSAPIDDTIKKNDYWMACARYKDTKTPIALSVAFDGKIYATIPYQNAGREIEAFIPKKPTFSDYSDLLSVSYEIEWMSKFGILNGNDKNEIRPYDEITRAEAVSMIMRTIGLENMPEFKESIPFTDVTKQDWFYNAVNSAYCCNIINDDSEARFFPHGTITREEVAVMAARALEYVGLKSVKSQHSFADFDKVSKWAKNSYEILGESCIYSYVYDETNRTDKFFLSPQSPVKRHELAALLQRVTNLQVYARDIAVKYGFDKEMPTIDGSTSTYPFTREVYSALFYNGITHPMYPQKHSKSHASYKRLINGEVDMLFASVYPASDILSFAEEKGVELELIPIAYDAMVFFTNKDNPIYGITKEQISDIYVNDAYESWSEIGGDNALLYPYCRNNDSGSHAQMERHFLNGGSIHPEVRKETSYTMSDIITDVIDAKTDNPKGYGLGYSIFYYYHNMYKFYNIDLNLKLLAVDGVMPSDETIADGTYPLSNNTYIVLRKNTPENSPARKMAEFMLTEEGQQCVENAGYGRLMR